VEAVRFDTYYRYVDLTRHARDRKLVRGVVCEIDLPEGATLIGDTPRKVLGQLEGRSGKPSSPSGWAGQATDVTDDRSGRVAGTRHSRHDAAHHSQTRPRGHRGNCGYSLNCIRL